MGIGHYLSNEKNNKNRRGWRTGRNSLMRKGAEHSIESIYANYGKLELYMGNETLGNLNERDEMRQYRGAPGAGKGQNTSRALAQYVLEAQQSAEVTPGYKGAERQELERGKGGLPELVPPLMLAAAAAAQEEGLLLLMRTHASAVRTSHQ
jgi:hypothetical protein